ncbi:hypothetical protein LGR80_21740 [Enterobacter hormaechei subsp. xiangfangensis]|uniref:hypothetical protein n=1 Tax=Enterobacter hormaechei TaxID=158836 RepID=UPI001F43AD4A|nr:hypothetical protein [Enterobacter hormaechei]MCF2265058.1 hypothetical protein [Enterobacter hormaechei subsp. xiangfangensis]
MELKKTNLVLLAINIVLFIVAILVLIKVLFSDFNGFEWGSVTDWVNSLSTLGTLGVAYAAYRKAPEWISQRKHDSAFDIAKKIILEDVRCLKQLIDNAVLEVENLSWQFDIISSDPFDFINLEDCDKALNIYRQGHITPNKVRIELSKLNKLGWEIRDDANSDLEQMNRLFLAIHKRYVVLWTNLKRRISVNERVDTDLCSSYLKQIKNILELQEKFDVCFSNLYSRYPTFDLYFDKHLSQS